MPARDIATVTADDFEPRLDDEFRLRLPAGELALRLTEVRRLGQAHRDGGAFAITFAATGAPVLPQATYPISHPALGTLEMFIVPIGPVKGGMGYEAVFT